MDNTTTPTIPQPPCLWCSKARHHQVPRGTFTFCRTCNRRLDVLNVRLWNALRREAA